MSNTITLASRPDATLASRRVLPDLTETPANALEGLSKAQLVAMIEALKSAPARGLSLKVSEKGALCLYGMGRWPVTLYASQWERLLDHADAIRAALLANAHVLTRKETA